MAVLTIGRLAAARQPGCGISGAGIGALRRCRRNPGRIFGRSIVAVVWLRRGPNPRPAIPGVPHAVGHIAATVAAIDAEGALATVRQIDIPGTAQAAGVIDLNVSPVHAHGFQAATGQLPAPGIIGRVIVVDRVDDRHRRAPGAILRQARPARQHRRRQSWSGVWNAVGSGRHGRENAGSSGRSFHKESSGALRRQWRVPSWEKPCPRRRLSGNIAPLLSDNRAPRGPLILHSGAAMGMVRATTVPCLKGPRP